VNTSDNATNSEAESSRKETPEYEGGWFLIFIILEKYQI